MKTDRYFFILFVVLLLSSSCSLFKPEEVCAKPTIQPPAGAYAGQTWQYPDSRRLQISITCDTPGATITKRSDETGWSTYTGPFWITIKTGDTNTVQAKASKEGYGDSPVASAGYLWSGK